MKPDILRQILFKVSNSSAQNNHNEQQQMNKNENLTGSESILNIFDTNWRPQFLLSDHNNKLDIQINSIPNQQTNSQQQFLPESSLSLMEPNSLLLSGQPELLFNFQPQMFTTPSAFLPTYSLDEFTSFGLPPLDLSNDWKFDKSKNDCTDSQRIFNSNHQNSPCSTDDQPIRSSEPKKVEKCSNKDDYSNDDDDNNDNNNNDYEHHDDKEGEEEEQQHSDDDNPLPYDPFEYLNRHRKSIQSNKEIDDGSQNYIEELPETTSNPEKQEDTDNHDIINGKDISEAESSETSESPSNVQEKEEPESEPEPDADADADSEDLRDDFDNQFDTQTATKNEPRGDSDGDEPPSNPEEEDDDRDDDDDDDRDNEESFPIPTIEEISKKLEPLRRTRRNIAISSILKQKPKDLKSSESIDLMSVHPNYFSSATSQPFAQSMLMESDHSPMKEFDDEIRYHSKPYPHYHTYYRERKKQKHNIDNQPSNMQQMDPYSNDYGRQTFYRPKKRRQTNYHHHYRSLPFVYTNLDDHQVDLEPNKSPLWSFSNPMNEQFYPPPPPPPTPYTSNRFFLPSNDFGSPSFPYFYTPQYLPASVSFGDPFDDPVRPRIPDYHNPNYDPDHNSTPEDYIDDGTNDQTGNDDTTAVTVPTPLPDYEDHENQPLDDPNDDEMNQNTLDKNDRHPPNNYQHKRKKAKNIRRINKNNKKRYNN